MASVAVVTPTYCTYENGRLDLLVQNIFWARRQEGAEFVHVIVDDGSTDGTFDFLTKTALSEPRLKVLRKENGGSSLAINVGADFASQEFSPDYITVLHSDDLLTPQSLCKRIDLAVSSRAQFVFTDMLEFNDLSGKVRRCLSESCTPDELFGRLLRSGKGINYPTMLWRSEFFREIGGYDPEITSSEDWDIALRSLRAAADNNDCVASSHDLTVANRVHANNLGIQNARDGTKWRCYKRILAKHLNGYSYAYYLARHSYRIARAIIPRNIKGPIVHCIDELLNSQAVPYRDEFIEHVRRVNYELSN